MQRKLQSFIESHFELRALLAFLFVLMRYIPELFPQNIWVLDAVWQDSNRRLGALCPAFWPTN